MSYRRNSFGNYPPNNRQNESKSSTIANDPNTDLVTEQDLVKNILPDFLKSVRKLLPYEFPYNMHVYNVECVEGEKIRLMGTLYLTNFRLVFAPDDELYQNQCISSGNKFLGDYDIPLTSIYKINVAPVNTRTGFKSFLNENQIQSETRTFTIITRDFRIITYTKCSVTKSNTNATKHHPASMTKMEHYIDALKTFSRFQYREQTYLYAVLRENSARNFSSHNNSPTTMSPTLSSRLPDEISTNFCLHHDDRIKSYLIANDWDEELYEANELRWVVDRKKFNEQSIINSDGPYVRLVFNNSSNSQGDIIWHWTHTSQVDSTGRDRRQTPSSPKYMLITVTGIGDVNSAVDQENAVVPTAPLPSPFSLNNLKKSIKNSLRRKTIDTPKSIFTNDSSFATHHRTDSVEAPPDEGLRRATTDTILTPLVDYVSDQPFQRYNLSKFPCSLKRLQTSYEKLFELCVSELDNDDEKWLGKLNACKWLKYIQKTLHGAASLAKLLDYKNIELTGSDTDGSCLMSSLVQILLRPKCRTIKGFCELIVREWLVRGHRFLERFGQVLRDANGNAAVEAPTFLLFLDCVHQLIVQNPFSFEFTDHLLLEFYHHVCHCYHHTFVFNDVVERLHMIGRYSKNIFVLSSFDFSLYLDSEARNLIKNYASIFNQPTPPSSNDKKPAPRIEATVIYPSSVRSSNRAVYYLEAEQTNSVTIDIPIISGSAMLNAEQYEYDVIQSPQIFPDNLSLDWRMFNLVLWSKCYCRYDINDKPTWHERQIISEVNWYQDEIDCAATRSKQEIVLDTFQQIGHANSWYPKTLVTRV